MSSFKNEDVITPRSLVPALVSLTAFAVSANANNFGPFGCSTCGSGFNASAFNVVTLGTSTGNAGNFTPNSDIGGGIAVYGSYTGNGYAINQQYSSITNPYTDKYALIVNGSITTSGQFTMGSGINLPVWVGGTYTAFNSPAPTVVHADGLGLRNQEGSDPRYAGAEQANRIIRTVHGESARTNGKIRQDQD